MQKIIALILLALATLACNTAGAIVNPPTETPLPPPTDTATPSNTPLPTPNFTATAEARATEDYLAALDLVSDDLKTAGYSQNSGRLIWTLPRDLSITADEFGSLIYDPVDPDLILANFILSVDITWRSETGLSGCGIMFRAEDDIERGEQIRFATLRLSGLPVWEFGLYRYGYYQSSLLPGGGAQSSRAISVDDNSTNHYVIVVNNASATAYSNGIYLGAGTMPLGRTEGQLGFFAFQDTGSTTCSFADAWIWELP